MREAMKITKEMIEAGQNETRRADKTMIERIICAALTVRKAQKRARRDTKLPEAADVRGIAKLLGECGPYGSTAAMMDAREAAPRIADCRPEWDGKFGIGPFQDSNGDKITVISIEDGTYLNGFKYGEGVRVFTKDGSCITGHWNLIRPWKDKP
jgi:hypothetical protein